MEGASVDMVWPIKINWRCKVVMDLDKLGTSRLAYQQALISAGFNPPAKNNAISVGYDWWRWGN